MQAIAMKKNVKTSSLKIKKKFDEEISDLHDQLGVQNRISVVYLSLLSPPPCVWWKESLVHQMYCNTEIAGMRDRKRDNERQGVRGRVRERMTSEDEKRWTKKQWPKRTLKSWREKALLLLNIKVIAHATFWTTSLSFLNTLSVLAVELISPMNPCLKLKDLYLCLASVLTV